MTYRWLIPFTLAFIMLGCSSVSLKMANPESRKQGQIYYVGSTGDDNNSGLSPDLAWRTIQHAADTVSAGDTVNVREGVYSEAVTINVSGSKTEGYITFQNYADEQPIIDGRNLVVPDSDSGLFLIQDQSYLIIDGFELQNYRTTTPNRLPVGIHLRGGTHHIQLLNNTIHHIETNAPVDGDLLGADAHGIAVYGTDENNASRHLLIQGNTLHDLRLGSSEAMVLNGNVELFTVTQNLIHDADNIALDFIGFEETAPDSTVDQARNGLVSYNTIYNIDTLTNLAYGGEQSAGGIYVDGGRDIIIEYNRIFSANIGLEIASEHQGRATSHITVRNNLLYHNHIAGLAMGGYDTGRGSTEDCVILNNTLFHNDTVQDGNGELLIQFDTRNNIIKNNIFIANDQSLFISNIYPENQGNVVDYNLYFASVGAEFSEWGWQDTVYEGFDNYRSATGNDGHAIFAEPQFASGSGNLFDFHLADTSPAIDAGQNLPEAGNLDLDGQARIQGGAIDIGVDEFPQAELSVYIPLLQR